AAAPKYVPPPPAPEEGPDIFLFVEHMPLFDESCKELPKEERKSCSDRKLLQFIMANVNYPAMARENGIEGTAVISFTVEKDGSVSEIEAVREVAGGCTEAALKAVAAINRKGKKFTPGIQQGREVRVRFNLPVAFRLE
ncbi:MAG: energy transducer TonB, partial [Bacteroidota bacterium]